MNIKATTIIAVKKDNQVAIAGDGQVTFGNTVMKNSAKKIRKIYDNKIITGFAGSVADAFELFEKFENKLDEHGGVLKKAAVELTKEWRKKGISLEAMLIVADKESLLLVSGKGEVIEPDDNIAAIGSGGSYAYAAAKALYYHTDMSAKDIVKEALNIAGEICIYTNQNISVETLD
ncbi:MAG: ATP-dependent HslUV protease, peptidase subunit HslV [Fusobacteriaceae bacterium]|jgi:ATP-dependent HslUV protease subunit HslV|nr:dependent peptidase CodWX, CodW component [Fusobacteriales bacterium]MDN5303272.1 ATP-dependent HslUV protease, peptidase subunit HslV [Fusobacteriaceae bacterium]